MRNYVLSDDPITPRAPLAPDAKLTASHATDALLPEIRVLKPGEHPFGERFCRIWDGMLIEPPMLLTALLADFRIAGGEIVQRELHSPTELQQLSQKLVFNCTGLGAKALFNDAELTPVRGQLTILVPQPEVTYATAWQDTYMFSRHDGVVLGGTHEEDNWSLEVDEATVTDKLAKQAALFNSMRDCRVPQRT
jgi:glycine/D-amino acid oxidase-like deaminating enzyme